MHLVKTHPYFGSKLSELGFSNDFNSQELLKLSWRVQITLLWSRFKQGNAMEAQSKSSLAATFCNLLRFTSAHGLAISFLKSTTFSWNSVSVLYLANNWLPYSATVASANCSCSLELFRCSSNLSILVDKSCTAFLVCSSSWTQCSAYVSLSSETWSDSLTSVFSAAELFLYSSSNSFSSEQKSNVPYHVHIRLLNGPNDRCNC